MESYIACSSFAHLKVLESPVFKFQGVYLSRYEILYIK